MTVVGPTTTVAIFFAVLLAFSAAAAAAEDAGKEAAVVAPPPPPAATDDDGTCEADGDDDDHRRRGRREATTTAATDDDDADDRRPSSSEEEKCGMYLAESTIPGAGLGAFAGRDFRPGDDLVFGEGDDDGGEIVVPLVEIRWNNGYDDENDESVSSSAAWDGHAWPGDQLGMEAEAVDDDAAQGCFAGLGGAFNYHPYLLNAKFTFPSRDSAGLSRRSDPGAGAFSYYRTSLESAAHVPAGGELFLDYGESWIAEKYKWRYLPLSGSYRRADRVLKWFFDWCAEHEVDDAVRRDLWKIAATGFVYRSRTSAALPSNFDDAKLAYENGVQRLILREATRSVKWLESNGACADNLRVGRSTIEQAGRGAFAARSVPRGAVVAPAPLIRVPDKNALNVYGKVRREDGSLERDGWGDFVRTDEPIGRQLLLNYCFGHSDSAMVLCPYGSAASMINHDSDSPNVSIRWAQGVGSGAYHDPSCLNQTVDDLRRETNPGGLGFEFVALRDINPGEEVFLDYGTEWESAWKGHVERWTPSDISTASKYNEDVVTPLRTREERREGRNPYPSSVKLKCSKKFLRLKSKWKRLKKTGELDRALNERNWVDCDVLSREEVLLDDDGTTTTTTYTGEYFPGHFRKSAVIENMPREAFRFEDAEPSSDVHLNGAFRHEIGIPDNVFPIAWKNKG